MNWLREHWRALQSALARVRSAPGGFVFNVVVIALALVLPLLVSGASVKEATQRARVALDRVDLGNKADLAPQALSGGEQQRVSIARAIVHKPRIILADEPTANLDRDSGRRVMDMLHAFHTAGVTCIIATHDERLLQNADRVIQLERGRVIAMHDSASEVGA